MAKMPAPTEEVKAKAAEAAAKSAWSDKVAAYQTCRAQDRAVAKYRATAMSSGKPTMEPMPTPPCADPGPFAAPTPPESKPIEASGAHSPPGNASGPPSTNATAAEIAGGVKKQ
jgi:hypothetical protein